MEFPEELKGRTRKFSWIRKALNYHDNILILAFVLLTTLGKSRHQRVWTVMLQVLVPPSTKASNWLYHQCRNLSGYPQFYICTARTHDPSLELASRNKLLEVSGFGTAVCLHGSSHIQKGYSLLARCFFSPYPSMSAFSYSI